MKNLKKLRLMEKMSQQDLANLLNVSEKDIKAFEAGTKSPKIETLKQMATIFHVSISTLLDQEKFWLLFPTANHRKLVCKIVHCNGIDLDKINAKINMLINNK